MVGTTLAQQTIKRVSDGLESGEAAGLSEIVELIQQLSAHALDTSVQDLASLIGKDLVVTAKVITAANTIGYNPTGVDVATLTQAIQVIGFNKIRQLAMSLLLIENAERTLNSGEKREIAGLALCSGLMAESVMEKHGTNSPEHAFICASLRSYGRILMTTFMIEEYRRARWLAAQDGASEDQAFNQVFGLTPLELGYHLLASAHLPEPILKTLQSLPPDAVRKASQSPDVEILLLADLSVKLCELALRTDLSVEEFEKSAQLLSTRTGRAFGLDIEGLLGVLRETGQQLSNFANTFGLNALNESLGPRIKARVARKNLDGFAALPSLSASNVENPPAADKAALITPSASAVAPKLSETGNTNPAVSPLSAAPASTAPVLPSPATESARSSDQIFQHAFETCIEQLANFLDEQPVDMEKIFRTVMQAALEGFATGEGIMFVRERANLGYTAQLGQGSLFNVIRRKQLVRESDRTVCGVCLQRMEDVFINDAIDPKIQVHLPIWLKTSALASFVLLPIHENRRPFALLLAGWPEKKTIGFTVSQIRQVRSMLRLVGTAHRLAAL